MLRVSILKSVFTVKVCFEELSVYHISVTHDSNLQACASKAGEGYEAKHLGRTATPEARMKKTPKSKVASLYQFWNAQQQQQPQCSTTPRRSQDDVITLTDSPMEHLNVTPLSKTGKFCNTGTAQEECTLMGAFGTSFNNI
ncbi:hypothetical protein COOONC_12376 [Cooperia oncophora]